MDVKLDVTQREDGIFECVQEGATGKVICGRGASVLEAVGAWCVYSQQVTICCRPPRLLEKFRVGNLEGKIQFMPAPERT